LFIDNNTEPMLQEHSFASEAKLRGFFRSEKSVILPGLGRYSDF